MEGRKLKVGLRMPCRGAAFLGGEVREESGLGIASPRREIVLV